MKKQLFSIAALLAASFATAAGGMVFTNTINSVLPDHPSLNGTYWGWEYRTNLSHAQVPSPDVGFLETSTDIRNFLRLDVTNQLNFIDPSDPAVAGYRVYARRDPSIDFRVGSSIRAKLLYTSGWHIFADSPVPGAMIGIQDSRGYFFGLGFAHSDTPKQQYVRIITSPFTGAGSEWIPIPVTSDFFNQASGNGFSFAVELVIAGSRASVLINGREMKIPGGGVLAVDAAAPLTNLIFSHWINHGGAIVGDYSTTSAGSINLFSLSYY